MRNFLDIINEAARTRAISSQGWIDNVFAREDVNQLYLHGSDHSFDSFSEPDTDIGRLIFSTKLVEPYEHRDHKTTMLQAEYYGRNLYLIKIHFTKRFNPNPKADPVAAEIFRNAINGQWDWETKVRYGRFDYQDAHLVVPPAVEAGYDFFRIYEQAMQGSSHAAAHASMIEIVDRFLPEN